MTIGTITLDADGKYVSGILPKKDDATPTKIKVQERPKVTCTSEFTLPDSMAAKIPNPLKPAQAQQPQKQIFAQPIQQEVEDVVIIDRRNGQPLEQQPIKQPVEDVVVIDRRNEQPIKPLEIQQPVVENPVINNIAQNNIDIAKTQIINQDTINKYINNYIQNTYNTAINNNLQKTYINTIEQNNLKNYAIYENINNYVAQQNLNNMINNQFTKNIFARAAIAQAIIQEAIYADAATRMMENMMLARNFAPVCRPRRCARRRCCCPRCAQRYYYNPVRQMRRNIMAMQMMAMYTQFMTTMSYMFGRMLGAQYAQGYAQEYAF